MVQETYKELSEVYDDLSIEAFSLSFGKAILTYLEDNGFRREKGLDLCCGTGALCRTFHEQGIEMTGVDLSPEMIEQARKAAPGCTFLCADIATLGTGQKADFVTCLNDSINHISSKKDLAAIFDTVWELLPEGGLFAFDIINPDALCTGESYPIRGKEQLTGIYTVTEEEPEASGGDSEESRIVQIGLTVKKGEAVLFHTTSRERLYDRTEIWEMLMDSGFTMPVCTTAFYNETTELKYKILAVKV